MDKTKLWTDAFLDAKRLEGDPVADDLVRYAYNHNLVSDLNSLLKAIGDGSLRNQADELDVLLDRYLETTGNVPEWFQPESFKRCHDFFAENELPIMACLLFAALPMSFAAAKGAEVLVHTHRMTNNPFRRNLETIQMVRSVMAPDGIDIHGEGIQTLQKVRLLHAAVRYLLLKNGWDVDTYGVPINQEDLAGTSMLFSYVVAVRLPYFGTLGMDNQLIEDYIHMWKVFGHIMGTQLDMLSDTKAEAKYLSEKIRARHFAPSEAGKLLTESLLEMVEVYIPDDFDPAAATLLRYFCGNDVGDILGVEKRFYDRILPALRSLASLFNGQRWLQPITLDVIDLMFENMYKTRILDDITRHRASYSLPQHLVKTWKKDIKGHSAHELDISDFSDQI